MFSTRDTAQIQCTFFICVLIKQKLTPIGRNAALIWLIIRSGLTDVANDFNEILVAKDTRFADSRRECLVLLDDLSIYPFRFSIEEIITDAQLVRVNI